MIDSIPKLSPPPARRPLRASIVAYLGAIGLVAVAWLMRVPLEFLLQGSAPYALFYLAVLASAWLWGVRPAIVTAIVSAIVTQVSLIPQGEARAYASLIPYALACTGMVIMARTARTLRSREERANGYLAALIRSTDDAVVSKDLNGIVQSCNPACEQIFGWSAKELIGKSILTLIPEDRHAEEAEILARLRNGDRIDHFETVRMRKDGQRIQVSLSISPVFNAEGAVIGVSKIARDITRQRHSEELVAEQREWFERTLESIGDAVIATDVHGNIEFMNPVAEHLTGWRAAEVRGRACEEVFRTLHEATREPIENPVRRALGQGVVVGSQERTLLTARDGTEHPVDDSASPIRSRDGRIIGVVLVFRDVMERWTAEHDRQTAATDRDRLLDAERTARTEAERANRVKDDFMAMVSHELRTPLNAILGWSNVLLKNESADAETKHGLEVIQRNTRIQAQLISDLLDISRIVSGKLLLDVQRINLAMIIDDAIETVQHAADQKGIMIRRRIDTAVGDTVGDPARLQQAIWNLLTNAIKFTERGGHIDITLQRVESRIEISVTDDGAGIRRELLDRIFERFHQQDRPTTRQYGGLGLGLSIVKNLVELHGGTVRAESAGEAKGAQFTISLPMSLSRPTEGISSGGGLGREFTPADRDTLRDIRILVVEDEEDTRNMICRLLEAHGAEVAFASNATDALDSVKQATPQILVSDIGLPGIDGYELIRQVRALHDHAADSMPAVALTAFARSEDRTRALRAGYQVHISKPVEPAELVATLASFADLVRTRRR